jgi:adenylate cyclase class 2
MTKRAHREEIEIKLAVQDLPGLRANLKRLGAREISPRTYETNTLYDTPAQSLRRRGQLLRIRSEQPPTSSRRTRSKEEAPAILTYKGPPARASRAGKTGGSRRHQYKIKEEAEIRASGAGELARIVRALGFQPAFRYEKFRTTYALPSIAGLKIELDETPIGAYLELEGSIAGIDRAARLLGYTRRDYVTASYAGLYLAECRRRGHKPGHMLFPPTKKSR